VPPESLWSLPLGESDAQLLKLSIELGDLLVFEIGVRHAVVDLPAALGAFSRVAVVVCIRRRLPRCLTLLISLGGFSAVASRGHIPLISISNYYRSDQKITTMIRRERKGTKGSSGVSNIPHR
jgi:hypothetical protein